MKKFKCFMAALLSVGVLASAAAFTACSDSDNGDTGDGDVTITAGEQVANEAEWKQAFDNVLNANSFTVKSTTVTDVVEELERYTSSIDNSNIAYDINNGKCFARRTGILDGIIYDTKAYFEVRDTNAWQFSDLLGWGVFTDVCVTGSDFQDTKKRLLNEDIIRPLPVFYISNSIHNEKQLNELFSNFIYENGYYVSDNLYYDSRYYESDNSLSPCKIKLSISSGCISGLQVNFSYSFINEERNQVEKYVFTDINSTTVTAPEGAKEAIDAAEAEAGKTN